MQWQLLNSGKLSSGPSHLLSNTNDLGHDTINSLRQSEHFACGRQISSNIDCCLKYLLYFTVNKNVFLAHKANSAEEKAAPKLIRKETTCVPFKAKFLSFEISNFFTF